MNAKRKLFSIHAGLRLSLLGWVIFALCSCGNTRSLVYMQGKFDTAALRQARIPEDTIHKGDQLSIIVYSDNPEATKIYNQPEITTASGSAAGSQGGQTNTQSMAGNSPAAGGYMVDENGNIDFQGLGLLHVDSLTKSQLKDTLMGRLKNLLVNPYFSVRFLNYRITMLGEVSRPGVFPIPGDHISLLEALGIAGDMTFYGRRDDILVIREQNGERQFARLDITKPEVMASPFFYLQSNDVVIVEPTKKKIAASDQTVARNIAITASIVSTLALLYSIFK